MMIKVPATTANIGPGFDSLGLALSLYNYIIVKEGPPAENLSQKAFDMALREMGMKEKDIRIEIEGEVPIARGLGSSATCIIGGILAANEITGGRLSREDILELAYKIEGHPDNIVPALVGGLTVSFVDEEKIRYIKLCEIDFIDLVLFIPDFTISTSEARKILPQSLSYRDAVFNIGRVSLLVSCFLKKDISDIRAALEDRLHFPYRKGLVKNIDLIFELSYRNGAKGVFLSGSGPAVAAIVEKHDKEFDDIMKREILNRSEFTGWDVKRVTVENEGAEVMKVSNFYRNCG